MRQVKPASFHGLGMGHIVLLTSGLPMSCLVGCVVVGPHDTWQQWIPLHSVAGGVLPQRILESLVAPLHESVILRMIGCGIQFLNSRQLTGV